MDRRIINPWTWQEPFGFVHAHEVKAAQSTRYCAGQLSTDDNGHPVHAGDLRAQVSQAFDNLERVLQEAGYTLADVTRLNDYTTDVDGLLANWDETNGLLIITSDHGTLEEIGHRQHTRHPVPTILVGQNHAQLASHITDLTHIAAVVRQW